MNTDQAFQQISFQCPSKASMHLQRALLPLIRNWEVVKRARFSSFGVFYLDSGLIRSIIANLLKL